MCHHLVGVPDYIDTLLSGAKLLPISLTVIPINAIAAGTYTAGSGELTY